jgi:hypothetical protein
VLPEMLISYVWSSTSGLFWEFEHVFFLVYVNGVRNSRVYC